MNNLNQKLVELQDDLRVVLEDNMSVGYFTPVDKANVRTHFEQSVLAALQGDESWIFLSCPALVHALGHKTLEAVVSYM